MSDKTWIQTYTGRQFWPLDPDPEHVDILDIAHALSNVCRFTGHVSRFYSVAEHSVRVCRRVRELGGDTQTQLWALLHDASEAYLSDIARPVKRQPEFVPYRAAEARLQYAICVRFGLPAAEPALVRQADNEMLWTEAHALLPGGPHAEWGAEAPLPLRDELGATPQAAELAFLLEYRRLTE